MMMRKWLTLLLLALSGWSPAAAQPAAPASPVRYNQPLLAITHVRLVDGTGAAARPDVTVIVRDGRIAAVGPARRTPVPPGATVIDGVGKTLLPGFVFLHEHMFYPAGGRHFSEMPVSFPPLYLAGGVTTARTGGSIAPYVDLNLRTAIANRTVIGPDLDVSGPYIEGPTPLVMEMHGLANPDEAERFVNFWLDQGATSLKAYMMLPRASLQRAIEVAHRRGARVTGHLCAVTYREAAAMGIDNLEHGFAAATDFIAGKQPDVCPLRESNNALDDVDPDGPAARDLIRFLVDHHVALTSTLTVFEDMTPGRRRLSPEELALLNPDARRIYEAIHRALDGPLAAQARSRLLERSMQLERRFADAGGLLLAGSDPTGAGGALPGFASIRQLQLLVEAGFTFERAVQVATLNGARYLQRDREVGSVEVGKRADLILVDGDPVADAAALARIVTVFKAGVGFDRAALLAAAAGHIGTD